jgi:hypothetical protein
MKRLNRFKLIILFLTLGLLIPSLVLAASAFLPPNPKFMALDANGDPYVGAKLYTYETGTTTPKTTWTDYSKGTANTNPIILDSRGQANVWIDSTAGAYRFKLDNSSDVTLWTKDNIVALGEVNIGLQLREAYALASGTNTYTAALNTQLTVYTTGDHYLITFPNISTVTDPTLNIDSLGAKTIRNNDGTALSAGSIGNDHPAILKYDGTYLILLNPATVSDTAYDATSWNGVLAVAGSKNAVRDEFETKADSGTNSDITSLAGLTTPLSVAQGGSGVATLTDHGILLGSGTGAITPLGEATDGQLPIGDTGGDPILAAITGTSNQLIVTNAAGSITLSTPQDTHTGANPSFAGVTLGNEGLHILDTNTTHDLIIKAGSNVTADRILTLTTGDAARTLTLNSNVNISTFGATIVDDASAAAVQTTISCPPTSRTISAGTGLSGGGSLAANRTINHAAHTGEVTGSTYLTIASGAVIEARLGASAVAQAKLKTSQGSVSRAGGGGSNHTLPGGEYGFYPRFKYSGGAGCTGSIMFASSCTMSTSYVTNIHLANSANTIYAQQRYVTASGEIHWVFILRDKITKQTILMYQAPDHPCFGNGGKPLLVPHPFGNYDEAKHEVIVINPSLTEIEQMELETIVDDETKPNKDLLEVITESYEIDENSNLAWPSIPVTVGLPKYIKDKKTGKRILVDYRFMRRGDVVVPIKKIIPKPDYIKVKSLKRKKIISAINIDDFILVYTLQKICGYNV